jgi:hypothetical protein
VNIEKIIKKLPVGFLEDSAGMDETRLKAAIIEADSSIRDTERERDNDDKLKGAKELVKDISGPYRDAIGAQRAKVSYCLHRLEERGAPTSPVEKPKKAR